MWGGGRIWGGPDTGGSLYLVCVCSSSMLPPGTGRCCPGGAPSPRAAPRPPQPGLPSPRARPHPGTPPDPASASTLSSSTVGAGAVGQVWGQGGCGVSLDSWRYLGGSYGCWGGPGWGAGGLGEQLRGMWGRVGGAWGGSGVLGRGVGCWGGARSRSGVLEVRVGGGGGGSAWPQCHLWGALVGRSGADPPTSPPTSPPQVPSTPMESQLGTSSSFRPGTPSLNPYRYGGGAAPLSPPPSPPTPQRWQRGADPPLQLDLGGGCWGGQHPL